MSGWWKCWSVTTENSTKVQKQNTNNQIKPNTNNFSKIKKEDLNLLTFSKNLKNQPNFKTQSLGYGNTHSNESLIISWKVTIIAWLSLIVNLTLLFFIKLLSYLITPFIFIKDKLKSIFKFFKRWGHPEIRALHIQRKQANTYKEWYEISLMLDALEGNEKWKQDNHSNIYDYQIIEQHLQHLRGLSAMGDEAGLLMALRGGLLRKIGNIHDQKLYNNTYSGTKHLIEDYLNEVVKHLNYFYEYNSNYFIRDKKKSTFRNKFDFFYEIRQAYGRSALLLSGGAALGMYHFGTVKCLSEQNLLPKVICGSSVGSLIASLIGVTTDENMHKLFECDVINYNAFTRVGEKGSIKRKIHRLLTKGVLMDITLLQECIRSNLGDVTFKEAFENTGRILNITVASTSKYQLPIILNYLTAPNVLIWSAAAASCALWGLYEPANLMAKDHFGNIGIYSFPGVKWNDASPQTDLPMNRLSEMFNVNYFIVSQVNPHVAPFLRDSSSSGWLNTLRRLISSEVAHRLQQMAELGILPSLFCKLQPLITQSYMGDITIIPKFYLSAYLKIISNPTEQFRQECIVVAEKSTWPKIDIIKNNLFIERTLEKIVQSLREKLNTETINSQSAASSPLISTSFNQSNISISKSQPQSPITSIRKNKHSSGCLLNDFDKN
eukprot:TRINITY_DN11_c1_g1_i1.p1 TRINITY_DN11_c1_g1~~TRINITY_DN11_c1_g1_i1.p1  ORF type:complete len:704 (+),score=255.15 TRINITY_DN11_c1_g1_i1:124-2112(+)